jgi:hypothetical protein
MRCGDDAFERSSAALGRASGPDFPLLRLQPRRFGRQVIPVKPPAGVSLIFVAPRGEPPMSMSGLSLPHSSADVMQPAGRNATPISARGAVLGEVEEDESGSWPKLRVIFDRPRG